MIQRKNLKQHNCVNQLKDKNAELEKLKDELNEKLGKMIEELKQVRSRPRHSIYNHILPWDDLFVAS